jgi:hypothetical protein
MAASCDRLPEPKDGPNGETGKQAVQDEESILAGPYPVNPDHERHDEMGMDLCPKTLGLQD